MRSPHMKRMIPLFLLLVCMTLAGCAGVKVSFVGSGDYMSLRRGDILTTGELSTYTGASLQVVGIDKKVCDKDASGCRKVLMETIGLHSENRLSALAELWLKDAMDLEKQFIESGHIEANLNAYLETARYP